MGVPQRAYNLLRSYIGREFDRIQGVDSDAVKEFQSSMETPPAPEQEVTRVSATRQTSVEDRKARARSILGVPEAADFATIHAAYVRLNRRSDPANFPKGSGEARQAAEIQRRVQDAYRLLSADADATEVRFRSLELD